MRILPASGPLTLLLFLSLTACKEQAGTEVANAGSDEEGRGRTELLTEIDRVADLPLIYNPDLRPLVLSVPADDARLWVIQNLEKGYLETGRTNSLWDAEARAAFVAYADYTRSNTTNWPALKASLAEVSLTGCDDPMVAYMLVRYQEEERSSKETALQYLRAQEQMLRSHYHPVFKFMAGLRAAQAVRSAKLNIHTGDRLSWTTISLEDLARDSNAPVDEVFNAAYLWIEHSTNLEWVGYVTSDLDRLLEANWAGTERFHRYTGQVEVKRAWAARGKDFADTVTAEGWKGLADHLAKAEKALERAWAMNSNATETAYQMMQVELGQGRGRARMQTWFDRAMALDPNNYDAVKLMSFYLEPRWYGSDAAALQFARSCVESDVWGGRVPLILVDVHRSLATFHETDGPDYWQQTYVWQDVKASYEEFFRLNPAAVGWRHNYAWDAYLCGQYQAFLDQTKHFTSTNFAFFGSQEKFQDMIATAQLETAATNAAGPREG